MSDPVVLVPARMASVRLPGKPLADILGEPMIVHVWRRAVEAGNRDPQAWLGLAASYDRLRRNDLADRAYAQARQAGGETSAWLNNRGYSWMQRGDTRRASEALSKAATLDPENPLIRDNLATLETRVSRRR